jgi:glycosyltransferase involved in cell wall biosynthesis
MSQENKIVVLLSSYNGEKYLQEQLISLEKQTNTNFDLFIRDDGSTDKTVEIIKAFQTHTRLHVKLLHTEKNLGAMQSFTLLIETVLKYPQYEYIMLCDQDDVWFNDKVEISLNALATLQNVNDSQLPHLLYTDLEVVNDDLSVISPSFWDYFNLNPSKNSLSRLAMQCNVTGCTMIFNRSLAQLALPIPNDAVMHDHWLGLVATSMGKIDYIDEATIAYRQHGFNVMGVDHFGIQYIFKKAMKYFSVNEFHEVLGRQIKQVNSFLSSYQEKLSVKDVAILRAIITLEKVSFFERLTLVIRFKLYKQGLIRNIGLFLWLFKMGLLSK